jgi:hypothetical protein
MQVSKRKGPSKLPGPNLPRVDHFLLKLGLDARERAVELGAQTIDHGDDRDRNAGGNQTIFDGGSARVVFQETNKLVHHTVPMLL